jgi:hypothetical protein
LISALLSDENLVPLKPVQGVIRDIAPFHYRSCKRLNQTESAILMQFYCDYCYRGITLSFDFINLGKWNINIYAIGNYIDRCLINMQIYMYMRIIIDHTNHQI